MSRNESHWKALPPTDRERALARVVAPPVQDEHEEDQHATADPRDHLPKADLRRVHALPPYWIDPLRRRHSNLPSRMEPMAETAALAAHSGRAPGTDAERRAAVHLRERLAATGRDATSSRSASGRGSRSTHTIHIVVAIVGSVVAAGSPAVGAALVGRRGRCRRSSTSRGSSSSAGALTGKRASQNVESRRGRAASRAR